MTLFADKAATVAEMRADRLIVAGRTYFPGVTLSDDYIYAKVLAAERDIERQLRVFVEPVEVLPTSATQAERDALDADGTRWVEEPGYDLERGFFEGDHWGFLALRQKPVSVIHSMKWIYPAPYTTGFDVPDAWIRIDKKYGLVRLVPTGLTAAAPLGMFLLQATAGGRMVPEFIHIRYRAGVENAATKEPDLVDLIKKMAVLAILDDQYLPQSGSISADGLSETFSVDVAKFSEKIEARIETLRQNFQGVRMGVL